LNTYKQINIIIGLLIVGLVGTFLYYMFDSGYSIAGLSFGNRQAVASERQEEDNVLRGGALFARYCRACHGLTGTGALERAPGALPGAPLNQDANHPPALAASKVDSRQLRLSDTIHCGRVGTRMPPWSIPEGGALNDFQISQLVTLITSKFAPEGWDAVVEDGNHTDVFNPAKFLAADVSKTDTTIKLNDVSAMAAGDVIRIGLDEPGQPYELLKITEVNKDTNTLTVARGPEVLWNDDEPNNGIIGSEAIEHANGSQIYVAPQAPGLQVTGDSASTADAPCGQNKAAATPAGTPVAVSLVDGRAITLGDNFFDIDDNHNPEIDVAPGATVSATLTNSGSAPHNMRIDGPDGSFDAAAGGDDIISDPDQVNPGGGTATIAINLPAGTYNYRCDFHPDQMKGTVVVQ
jgi:plastocyanin/mono/diheme cytochrome c family protein